MSACLFEVGAVVRLKSGSPSVTVIGVIPERGSGTVEVCRVAWFDAGKMSEALLPSAAFEPVEATS